MNICVIGAGYVGLVTSAGLAEIGHTVTCCDSDESKISALNDGDLPIFEPDLADLITKTQANSHLKFTANCPKSVANCEVVIIAVGTPSDRDGRADMGQVFAAVGMIAGAATSSTLVLVKSTVSVGTGDEIARRLSTLSHAKFDVISNPEFLGEGSAVSDFFNPDRIVFGTNGQNSHHKLNELYDAHPATPPVLFTSRSSAEMIKYAANSFLAMKVSFINEMADICEKTGADVTDLAQGIGLDPRIGPQFLRAGPGFGGSCFPKDMQALLETADRVDAHSLLVSASVAANSARIANMAERVIDFCENGVSGKTIAMLGLTFKPNTDDIRASPAIGIARHLLQSGAHLKVFDPKGMDNAKTLLADAVFCSDAYDCVKDAEIVVLATEWSDFKTLDLKKLASLMARQRMVDLRNLFSAEEIVEAGFSYRSVGRADILS